MRRIILLFPVFATLAGMAPAGAQAPEDEVLAVVHRLLDGMRQADTTNDTRGAEGCEREGGG